MKRINVFSAIMLLIVSIQQLFSYMPNQVEAVLKALKNSTVPVNCAGCDLRGVQDFVGLDLHKIFMPSVAMQPCLQTDKNKNSMMICVEKQAANFTGANLSQAVLFSSCLDGIILDKADLTGADVTGSSLQYASLRDAIVKDIVTDHATFCHAIMPDGTECKDSWTGQGVTIACNCSQDPQAVATTVAADQKS